MTLVSNLKIFDQYSCNFIQAWTACRIMLKHHFRLCKLVINSIISSYIDSFDIFKLMSIYEFIFNILSYTYIYIFNLFKYNINNCFKYNLFIYLYKYIIKASIL